MTDATPTTSSGVAARISLWLAVLTPVVVGLVYLLMLALDSFGSTGPGLVGIVLLAAPVAHIVGIVFGIVAMVKRDRARLGALGAALNVAMIALGIIGMSWLFVVAAGAIHMN